MCAIPQVRKAVQVLEQARYKMGIVEFVKCFIDHWAYYQTGMFKPSVSMPDELTPVAMQLSHILAAAMKRFPGADVIGCFFSESGYYKNGLNFFPTPPELSRLMSALVNNAPDNESCSSFYEPCCGTGSIALSWLIEKYENKGVGHLE